jgi:hypothetical protein
MNSGKTSLVATAVFAVCSILMSSSALAAPSCSSFLIKTDNENSNLNPLEIILEEIKHAQTLEEANKLTYELMAFGNNVFDNAIDGIISINSQPSKDQNLAKQQAEQVQTLLEALQNALRIPSYVMNFAISNRLEIENAEAQQKYRAEQRKEAIGFIRTESAQDFHKDSSPKIPMGFSLKNTNKSESTFFKYLIDLRSEQAVAEKKASAEKEAAETPKAPLGFVHPIEDAAAEDAAPLVQPGFVQPDATNDSFKRSDVVQIVLNVQVGEFRIVEDKKTIGF